MVGTSGNRKHTSTRDVKDYRLPKIGNNTQDQGLYLRATWGTIVTSGKESARGSEPTDGPREYCKPDLSLEGSNLGRLSPDANGSHGPPCSSGYLQTLRPAEPPQRKQTVQAMGRQSGAVDASHTHASS